MSAWEGSEWQRRQEEAAEERRRQEEQRREQERLRQRPLLPNPLAALGNGPVVLNEEQKEQLIVLYLKTPEGCMKLAGAAYSPIHSCLEKVYEDPEELPRLETFIKLYERVEKGLTSLMDWAGAGTMLTSREAFDSLLDDMRKARDLASKMHGLRSHIRIDAMLEILRELL